jgi:hypothetical protein
MDPIVWLDRMLNDSKKDTRGKPDCYVVVKTAGSARRSVIAVFKTVKGLRKNFPLITEKYGSVTGACWWFDDDEEF